MTVHKADSHGKPGRHPRASKDGATFDTELQRYVTPSERVTMSKQSKSELDTKDGGNSGNEI